MGSPLSLILDDNSEAFSYSGGVWTRSELVQWYNGTSRYPGFARGVILGSFSLKFEGTSVAFVGNTPPVGHAQNASVSIDGGAPTTISYRMSPHVYQQWYKSPSLSEGNHTIDVGGLDQTAVDFAVITAGTNTSLSGKTAIADDTDSAIEYSGGWRTSSDEFVSALVTAGFPYNNSTRGGSTVGDSFIFRFTGTSVSVYGIFNWGNLGTLSATYTMDESAISSQSYNVTTSSPEFVKRYIQVENFLFFSSGNLSAGNHTLVVTITQCINQEFVLDYITYTPSFSRLALMPTSIGPVASASSSTSSSVSTDWKPTSSCPTIQVAFGAPIGPIVGSMVGALFLFCVLVSFLYLRLRRIEKRIGRKVGAAFDRPISVLAPGVLPFPNARQPPSEHAQATEFPELLSSVRSRRRSTAASRRHSYSFLLVPPTSSESLASERRTILPL